MITNIHETPRDNRAPEAIAPLELAEDFDKGRIGHCKGLL